MSSVRFSRVCGLWSKHHKAARATQSRTSARSFVVGFGSSRRCTLARPTLFQCRGRFGESVKCWFSTTENRSELTQRQRLAMNLRELLSKEGISEEEFTTRKMPSFILDELTVDYSTPLLPRIGSNELTAYLEHLQNGSTQGSLTEKEQKFLEILSDEKVVELLRFFCIFDPILHEFESAVNPSVNDVNIPEKDDSSETHLAKVRESQQLATDEFNACVNAESDATLMQGAKGHILCGKHSLDDATLSDLLAKAMVFFDISQSIAALSKNRLLKTQNRIASALLSLCAALGNERSAQLQLGKQYLLGYGVARDWQSAVFHFVRSAAQGSVESRAFLGSMYFKGYGVRKDMQRAHALLNESSRFGNAQGQRYLAEMYEKGAVKDGLLLPGGIAPKKPRGNSHAAVNQKRSGGKSADAFESDNSANVYCGDELQSDGENDESFEVKMDAFIALRLSEAAAGKGALKLIEGVYNASFVIEAATIAGRMYCLHSDFQSALAFFAQSAELGDLDAQCNLGHLLTVGAKGVEPDVFTAAKWLLRAANCGQRRAHKELGMLYAYGFSDAKTGGVLLEQNMREAVLWLETASKGGFVDCYLRLADIYACGNNRYPGVKQNFAVARKHLENARNESANCKHERDKLPEAVWLRLLRDPLHCRTLIASFEKAIGGHWRGSVGDLDPERLRKALGTEYK